MRFVGEAKKYSLSKPNQLQCSVVCCRPWQRLHPSRVTAATCSSGSSS